jgi:pimeloyl-ACP methyl ester carboxylesterase
MPLLGHRYTALLTDLQIRAEARCRRLSARSGAAAIALIRSAAGTPDARQERIRALEYQLESEHNEIRKGGVIRPVVHWHESGAGTALLLLNGWTASGLLWPHEWVSALADRYRVIRIDNRGSGWSRSAPTPFTIADMADDAAEVLRFLGIAHAIVVGFSMGGMIAQEMALRHPSMVQRLILVGTKPPTPADESPDPAIFVQALRPPAPGEDLRQYFATLWSGFCAPGFARDHPEAIAEIARQNVRRPTPRAGLFQQLRAVTAWRDPGRLEALRMPTAVVHGNADPLMPVGNGPRLARLIPTSTYHELADVGHLVAYESGQTLIDIINAKDAQ